MAEKEINEALFTLRQEVERLETTHPELKSILEPKLTRLEASLEASEDPNHLHLVEDIKESVSRFEIDHPTLSGVVNNLMLALSNMGI